MKIDIDDEALNAFTIADLASSVRTIKSLKMKGMEDRDDRKNLKALKRVLKYYCKPGQYDNLNLEGCLCEFRCDCGTK